MGLDAWIVRVVGPEPDDTEEVFYFRKVNLLHEWVTEHLNEGREHNCELIPMSLEAIAGLAQTCVQVLEEPRLAPHLLPTAAGFFFGSTDYDQFYLDDVTEVRDACFAILEHEAHASPPGSGHYAYSSWW